MAEQQYDAFLSYSHQADRPTAIALENGLQRFGKPWSPKAARSPWVDREVRYWCEQKPLDSLLIVLTDGDRTSTAATPALSEALREEPRFVDLRCARGGEVDLREPRFSPSSPTSPRRSTAEARTSSSARTSARTGGRRIARRVVTAIWDTDSVSWRRRACEIPNPELTRTEWQQNAGDLPYRPVCRPR